MRLIQNRDVQEAVGLALVATLTSLFIGLGLFAMVTL
jgi:hypothetical protein